MLFTKFSFGKAFSEEEIFQKSTNQKQEWPQAMFVSGSGLNEQSLQGNFHRCVLPKEKSQELSIRPCKSVIFKVDLYMKMFGLCTISRLNTIVNEKMRLFNYTYIKAQRAQSSFHFRFDQKFLEIVTFERVLPMGARPRPSLFLF